MRFNHKKPLMALVMLIAALALAVGISACGGGSSSSSSESTEAETTAPEETEGEETTEEAPAESEEEGEAGEVIASGTVLSGCGFDLQRRLALGDVVELEVEGIGILRNRVIGADARGAPSKDQD